LVVRVEWLYEGVIDYLAILEFIEDEGDMEE
jgi:hypothetical protein